MIEEQLPFYLSIGMSAEEFWHGTPLNIKAFRKSHEMKKQRTNQELWLLGAYFFKAVSAALAQAFSGSTDVCYPVEPFRITPMTESEKEAAADTVRQRAIMSLMAWETSAKQFEKR